MYVKSVTAAVLIAVSTAVSAIDDKEYASCAVIDGDLARLECFDKLARQKGLSGPQEQPNTVEGVGSWDVSVKINPIDDSKTVVLTLVAESGTGKFGRPIVFLARCQSGQVDAFIGWSDYLGRENKVLTRIGDKPATTTEWSLSTDSKATFHPFPEQFLDNMMKANKLVAQITPYNESPSTALFNTTGLSNAIKPLKEVCEW